MTHLKFLNLTSTLNKEPPSHDWRKEFQPLTEAPPLIEGHEEKPKDQIPSLEFEWE